MPVTQQQAIFTTEEAERFAKLWAGFDTGNASEAEAMGKGRALRRMLVDKKLRLVDALELPEIRKALDEQMQPVRLPVPDVAALQAENEHLRKKLAFVVPKLREVTQALAEEEKSGDVYILWIFAIGVAGSIFCFVLSAMSENWWGLGAATVHLVIGAVWFFKGECFERSCMNYLELVKEKALLCYAWAAHIFFGLNALMYIACCVVAGGPVGPITYIGWLYHCCQWKVS